MSYRKGYHDTLKRVNAGGIKRSSILIERCKARGWVERTPEWKYVLTDAGREQLAVLEQEAKENADGL